ncbi:hypothetical protein TWF696_000900 [Orbilia brochopaga]|uniref:F-box domain-containing protein n=1 Tax=Orbilia brochopaga TaxID=3140254 RepID=A0AAV9VCQ3_9PEZI
MEDGKDKVAKASAWTPPNLPVEIYIDIFSHLTWQDHISCMQVCPLWRDILNVDSLKRERYANIDPMHDAEKSGKVDRNHPVYSRVLFGGPSACNIRSTIDPARWYYGTGATFKYVYNMDRITSAIISGPNRITELELIEEEIEGPDSILEDSVSLGVPKSFYSEIVRVDIKRYRSPRIISQDTGVIVNISEPLKMSFCDLVRAVAHEIKRHEFFEGHGEVDMDMSVWPEATAPMLRVSIKLRD